MNQTTRKAHKVSAVIEKRIQALLRAKKGMLAVAKEYAVGAGTVQRIAREMAEVSRPFGRRRHGGMKRRRGSAAGARFERRHLLGSNGTT
jgi:hypothetical protein